MYSRQVMRKVVTLALLVMPFANISCGEDPVSVCPSSDPSCKPEVEILETTPSRQSAAQLLIPQEQSTKLRLRIVKRDPEQKQSPYPVWLMDLKTPGNSRNVGNAQYVEEHADGGGVFEITVGKPNPAFAPLGRYELRVGKPGTSEVPESSEQPAPQVTVIKRTIGYQSPTVLEQVGQTRYQYPEASQLGFVANEIAVFAGGWDGSDQPKQKLRRFQWTATSLVDVAVSGLFGSVFGTEVRVGLNAEQVLLARPMAVPVLSQCSLAATAPSDCKALPMSSLPQETKALAVSSDGNWAAYADKDGKVFWASLSGPFQWHGIASSGSKPFYAMAFGDVNGDQKPDLVGLWQDGTGAEVRAFLGTGSGFTESADMSRALSGIGAMPVSAMAVGDLDSDGYADVVVARGLTVTVYQNLYGSVGAVWQSTLESKQAGPKIGALAVGRLLGTEANQSLDIVAASNSPYDAMEKSNLYLHVFRPMQVQ